ncbi:MAG: DUF2806 domain-containing protein [Agathobacter sp.]|nr:DUF2806 domain-containing protein [Agathobacter sp.]
MGFVLWGGAIYGSIVKNYDYYIINNEILRYGKDVIKIVDYLEGKMDEFNTLIETVKSALPVIESGAQALVGGFISAMFLRGNTNRSEFEKIKAGKIEEALDELIKNRELTFTELVKCKNMLKIAEKADKINSENSNYDYFNDEKQYYDFDWFLRFFESAGNISNGDMQELWARVLNGEMKQKGTFSLRTLEILKNMSADEAKLFMNCVEFRMITPYYEYYLLNSDESLVEDEDDSVNRHRIVITKESDIYSIMSAAYRISTEKIRFLEEIGLLSSLFVTSTFLITKEPCQICNETATIVLSMRPEFGDSEFEFQIKGFRFSQSALELLSVINSEASLVFLLDYARLIERSYRFISVRVYKVMGETETELIYDDKHDILHDKEYQNMTRLPNLEALDEIE